MADEVHYELELEDTGDEYLVAITPAGDRETAAWQFPNGPLSVPPEFWPAIRAAFAQPEEDVERVAQAIHDAAPLFSEPWSKIPEDSPYKRHRRDQARAALTAARDGGRNG